MLSLVTKHERCDCGRDTTWDWVDYSLMHTPNDCACAPVPCPLNAYYCPMLGRPVLNLTFCSVLSAGTFEFAIPNVTLACADVASASFQTAITNYIKSQPFLLSGTVKFGPVTCCDSNNGCNGPQSKQLNC